jgi:hypothetical protein
MTNKEQKTEVPGLYKVSEGILINRDTDALNAYKRNKQRMMAVDTLQQDMKTVKEDINEIKELLKGLVK